MDIKNYKWFMNSWFFYSLLSSLIYSKKSKLNIEYNLNDKYIEIVWYLLIILIIFFTIKWLKKWLFQYKIRTYWITTLGEIKEEKSTGKKNYYKYVIIFIDNDWKEITFQERHTTLFLNERWKSDIMWYKPLWSKERPFPKINIIYDKFNSKNAIIS